MDQLKLNIAIAPDDKVIKPTCALLYSLCNNTKHLVKIYICSFGLKSKSIRMLKKTENQFKSLQLKFIYFNKNEAYTPKIKTKYPLTTLLRLLIPYKINAQKILYLDTDIIVKGDICKLYNLDISNYFFAAAKDSNQKSHISRLQKANKFCDCYFNAGVLLININKYKKFFSEKQIFEQIQSIDYNLWYLDQDLINCLFPSKQVYELNKYVYNLFNIGPSNNAALFADALIIHYAGNQKPWLSLSSPIHKCYFNEYWKNANACGIRRFPSYWISGLKNKIKRGDFIKSCLSI